MINYKNVDELTKMIEETTQGNWDARQISNNNWEICYSDDGECIADCVYEKADADFIIIAREALTYWINSERNLEKGLREIEGAGYKHTDLICNGNGHCCRLYKPGHSLPDYITPWYESRQQAVDEAVKWVKWKSRYRDGN